MKPICLVILMFFIMNAEAALNEGGTEWITVHTALMTQRPSGCEAGLNDCLREKAQHTHKYVSIFPANNRSKMPADGQTRTKPEHLTEWSYKGNKGPARWAELNPEFLLCAKGKQQSPINLSHELPVINTANFVTFHYQTSPIHIVDDGATALTFDKTQILLRHGHGIQLNFPELADTLVFQDKTYRLVQIHFHSTSENTLNGINFPMEIHFVHQGEKGQVLVVGVFVDAGKKNADLQKIIEHFPKDHGVVHDISDNINLANLLPAKQYYFSFMGSLTIPPCTEGVHWIVMTKPIEASPAQILLFRKAMGGNNARHIHDSNHRLITYSGTI